MKFQRGELAPWLKSPPKNEVQVQNNPSQTPGEAATTKGP